MASSVVPDMVGVMEDGTLQAAVAKGDVVCAQNALASGELVNAEDKVSLLAACTTTLSPFIFLICLSRKTVWMYPTISRGTAGARRCGDGAP